MILNDVILTVYKDGDDLKLSKIKLIPNALADNATIDMNAINEVMFEIFDETNLSDWPDYQTADVRCSWELADPDNGRNYNGYMHGDLAILLNAKSAPQEAQS